MKYYSFIVDTDSYAGNFEREMTAYVTGVVGECNVGIDEAELFHDEMDLDLDELMYQKSDGTCYRPCAMENNPNALNYDYNSVAMYFLTDPCEYLDMLKERSLEYAKNNNIKIERFRLNFIEETQKIQEIKSWRVLVM